ncbi:MAG: GNAT family N-acetyltransferase, partial [Planctomycetota bacterium]|nr:GNAT family N-acetyltransferase [Planctomycetota bacterium]
MQIEHLKTAAELDAVQDAWNQMAGARPFLRYEWLGSWWRHYATASKNEPAVGEPFVLAVYDPGDSNTPIGLAPWYLQRSWTGGRTLRFLGDGVTCTEYPTILCLAGQQSNVTAALAHWLDQQSPQSWDAIELSSCDPGDDVVPQLASHLEACGHQVQPAAGDACWRIELPSDWNEYLARLSKTNRKRARRLLRALHEGSRMRFGTAAAHDVIEMTDIMIQLHQRRRDSRNETGCFDSPRFCSFFRDATSQLFAAGLVQLNYLQLDDSIVAADYNLFGDDTIYAYQSGIDPDALQHKPGHLLTYETIRLAIENGYKTVDLLRGDEPYKANLRAERTETLDWRIVRATRSARLRHVAWLARRRTRGWAKQGLATARGWQTTAASTLANAWATAAAKRIGDQG